MYYVGDEEDLQSIIDTAKSSVEILKGITDIHVPEGIDVTNNSGHDVQVNGKPLIDGDNVIADAIPSVTVAYSNNGDWTNQDVKVTIKASEEIKDIKGWIKLDGSTFTKVFVDNAIETLTISDMTGNIILVKIDVKNIDKYAPEIKGIKDIYLVQGEEFDPLKGVTVTDKEDGSDVKLEAIKNTVDTSKTGTYEVVYKATDSDGAYMTKTIKVIVNPKSEILNHVPTIKAEDVTLTVGDKFEEFKGVTATDHEDGDKVKLEVIKNTVDTSKASTYEVTYKVTDSDGASAIKTIKVTVNDKTIVVPNTEANSSNTGNPETGDQTNMHLYMELAAISGLVIITTTLLKKRKKGFVKKSV